MSLIKSEKEEAGGKVEWDSVVLGAIPSSGAVVESVVWIFRFVSMNIGEKFDERRYFFPNQRFNLPQDVVFVLVRPSNALLILLKQPPMPPPPPPR